MEKKLNLEIKKLKKWLKQLMLLNKDKVAKRAELAEKQMDPMQDKKVIEAINKQKQEKEKERRR